VTSHQAQISVTGFPNSLSSPQKDGEHWTPGLVGFGPLQVAVPHELWEPISASLTAAGRSVVVICDANLVAGHWIASRLNAIAPVATRSETVTRSNLQRTTPPASNQAGREGNSAEKSQRQPAAAPREPRVAAASGASPFAALTKGSSSRGPAANAGPKPSTGSPEVRNGASSTQRRPAFTSNQPPSSTTLTDEDLDIPF